MTAQPVPASSSLPDPREELVAALERADLEQALRRWQQAEERAERAEADRDRFREQAEAGLGALIRAAAKAHGRKWEFERSCPGAFDMLHRIGDELIAAHRAIIGSEEGAATPARQALADAERIEAAAAILERRYPGTRPDVLDTTITELHSIARAWRRIAAGSNKEAREKP